MKQAQLSQNWHPSYLAVLCLFFGILAGTCWVNRMNPGAQEQLSAFGQAYLTSEGGQIRLTDGQFGMLLIRRAALMVCLWLAGMSPVAIPALCLASISLGFSMSFLISCMTVQAGGGGLLLFLASVFPQCLFFLPVGAVLTIWALSDEKKLHGGGFAILLFLTAAGTASELWLNPWLLKAAEGLLR